MHPNRDLRDWLITRLLQHRRTVVTIVLVIGGLLSTGALLKDWLRARLEVEENFRSDAAEHFGRLRKQVEDAVDSVASVADFLQTVGSVDRSQFREFVVPHLQRAPGLVGLIWSPRVLDGDRPRFEEAGRREWGPEFRIFEQAAPDRAARRRAEYFPVLYREVRTGPENARVVGKDWAATPARLEALRRARDTGRCAMTAGTPLMIGEKGVLVYWPIYRKESPRNTVEERRENLQGFVGAIFQINQLMESTLGELSQRGIEFAVYDEGGSADERTLYSYASQRKVPLRPWFWHGLLEGQIRSRLHWAGTLGIGGRRWAVSLTPTAEYVGGKVSADMWQSFLLGLAATGIIGGCLLLVMRRTDEVERLVDARTREVQRAEEVARNRASQLDAVRTVSLEVVREVNLDRLLELVVRQAGELLHTGTSTVWLWDETGAGLVPAARHGAGGWHREARMLPGEGVVGWVAARGKGLLINDYRTSPYAAPFFLQHTRTTAVVAEPLLYREQLLGVIGVDNEATGRPFTEEDRQILALFAPQAAIAIHTAQLFDEVAAGREVARRLAQQVLSIQEEERRRLARELYEEAAQSLSALLLKLQLLHSNVPESQASFRRPVQEATSLARETLKSLCLLARDLRPPGLETLGLNKNLEDLCREVASRTGLSISYAGAEVARLPDAVAICLYRVLQEALTNVVKHAKADRVQVVLRTDAETVMLSVEDNGQGFDPGASGPRIRSRCLGLPGMQERLRWLGGRLEIVSRPGKGTRLIAEVHATGAEIAGRAHA